MIRPKVRPEVRLEVGLGGFGNVALRSTAKHNQVHNRGTTFSIPLQINYEDTDAAGVVYYGNYPGYMERARNACLRGLGFPLNKLTQQYSVLFVVSEVRLKYLSAARLDDELEVTVEILQLKRASVVFAQQVRRGGEVLVDGEIRLALVNNDTFRPCRIPQELAGALNRQSGRQSGDASAMVPRTTATDTSGRNGQIHGQNY